MKMILFTLLLALPAFGATAKIQFRDTYVRYAATHDVVRLFLQKFPAGTAKEPNECLSLKDSNRAILGDANPSNGEVPYRGPSPSFVKYYAKCLGNFIKVDMEAVVVSPDTWQRYVGKKAAALVKGKPEEKLLTMPRMAFWSDLSSEVQAAIIEHLIEYFIGPGIVRDEPRLVQSLASTIYEKPQGISAYDSIARLVFFIATQDEFLTY